jgi:hypothetical protein
MKFLPTKEQLASALATSSEDLNSLEKAAELEAMEQFPALIKLYNAAIEGINRGVPPHRQWRYALILALRTGWFMREHAGSLSELANMIDEAEIEAMYREIRGSAA